MKITAARVAIFEDATAAGLETTVNAFLQTGGEKQLISVHYAASASALSAMIVYTT
jgi:hypothetical protein